MQQGPQALACLGRPVDLKFGPRRNLDGPCGGRLPHPAKAGAGLPRPASWPKARSWPSSGLLRSRERTRRCGRDFLRQSHEVEVFDAAAAREIKHHRHDAVERARHRLQQRSDNPRQVPLENHGRAHSDSRINDEHQNAQEKECQIMLDPGRSHQVPAAPYCPDARYPLDHDDCRGQSKPKPH